ncbi:chitin synthase [Geosmithia morbida]|uniref:Chitin synthase n=1 Tax=Geosmithia morbida TaxID=1094350 RepID=A0A9P4YUP1_9HYPO|nr:chitin synthase [Geosmithia morbida]KAF4122152.1 chitin synthase [Geosmithia morbida]
MGRSKPPLLVLALAARSGDCSKLVMILPRYSKDRVELETSPGSLIDKIKMEGHKKIIMVIVDGDVQAAGETKNTQDFLLDELFAGGTGEVFQNGYCARYGFFTPCTVHHGI